jgi:hypothetical protein
VVCCTERAGYLPRQVILAVLKLWLDKGIEIDCSIRSLRYLHHCKRVPVHPKQRTQFTEPTGITSDSSHEDTTNPTHLTLTAQSLTIV